jgi:hypothetical protein
MFPAVTEQQRLWQTFGSQKSLHQQLLQQRLAPIGPAKAARSVADLMRRWLPRKFRKKHRLDGTPGGTNRWRVKPVLIATL